MTINLEKALIKANKKLLTPEQLLIVKEYEQHAGLVDDDALLRVGLNLNLKGGQLLTQEKNKLKSETVRFKQERVFHISQIEQTCKNYHLRFLPSVLYNGTIDKELPFKINNFEAAYGVKCQCDHKPDTMSKLVWSYAMKDAYKEPVQNTFIMAPKNSFKLQERPKDPLFFYQINDEYFYLIHKWGNDLSLFRRIIGFWSKSFNWWLTLCLVSLLAIVMASLGGVSKFDVAIILINSFFIVINTILFSSNGKDYTPFRSNWNSQYLD